MSQQLKHSDPSSYQAMTAEPDQTRHRDETTRPGKDTTTLQTEKDTHTDQTAERGQTLFTTVPTNTDTSDDIT